MQSFQSLNKPHGSPCAPERFQTKQDGALHVTEHGVLALIGIGQHFPVERQIASLLDVGADRVEQPQAIVGAVLFLARRLLGPGRWANCLTTGMAPPFETCP